MLAALDATLLLGPNSLLVHTALSGGNDHGFVALIRAQKTTPSPFGCSRFRTFAFAAPLVAELVAAPG